MSTLLLKLVDEKKVSLDDKVSKYLPDIPHSDEVTLGELAQMTSGYTDYVIGNTENIALYADPFRRWTSRDAHRRRSAAPLRARDQLELRPHQHVLLGLALEKATGKKMQDLFEEKVLRPLGLKNTATRDSRDPVAGASRLHL